MHLRVETVQQVCVPYRKGSGHHIIKKMQTHAAGYLSIRYVGSGMHSLSAHPDSLIFYAWLSNEPEADVELVRHQDDTVG